MFNLKSYFKPFLKIISLIIIFLFCQALVDLNLPNLMSNIVNVGIQQGGIKEGAPKVINAQSYESLKPFMSEKDKSIIEKNYISASKENLNTKDWKNLVQTFPKVENTAAYAKKTDLKSEENKNLNNAFARTSFAFLNTIKDLAEQNNVTIATDTDSDIDQAALEKIIPLFQKVSPEDINKSVTLATQLPESEINQVAVMLTKSFYTDLGANTDNIQTSYILKIGAIMCIATILVLALAITISYMCTKVGTNLAKNLRRDLFTQVNKFTNADLNKFNTASLITRTTNDITQIQNTVIIGLRLLCYAPIMAVGATIMALNKSISMSWTVAVIAILIIGVMLVLYTVAMPKFRIMQVLIDKLNLVARENLTGMQVVRAFSNQKFEEKRFDKANVTLTKNSLFISRAIAFLMPIMTFIMSMSSVLILWVGAKQVDLGHVQVGDIMAFMQYAMHIIFSFLFISMMFILIPRASVSANRIYEVLTTEPSIKDPEHPKTFQERPKGIVEFKDVNFRYTGAGEDVLTDINFTALPGEMTAFIGSTGSGKTTLINLIPRFFDVTQGSITIDGIDIRDLSQKELRDNIGYMPQKSVLFSGSIATNLEYGKKDATKEEMDKSLKIAQASEFVNKLDDGVESPISQGGANVSGGQKQRLSIARALIKNPPIYIFDDTFSALDYKTDANLRNDLKKYVKDTTTIVVGQRISTIMGAEQIIVLDKGKIVGKGKHEELMKTCSTYQEIAYSQLDEEVLA